jgi:glycosyltransferase involved in cell wall biosynthesis
VNAPRARVVHVTTVAMSLRYLLLDQMRFLRDRGFEVHTASSPGADLEVVRAAGFPHHAVRLRRRPAPWADLVGLRDLVRLFRRLRPDLVHTHTPKASLLGQLAARWAGVPRVLNTIHGFPFGPRTHPLARRLWLGLERCGDRRSDRLLFQNSEDLALAEQLGIGPPDGRRWLGNGVDLGRFSRDRLDPRHQRELAEGLGLGGAPVVGFVGRLSREKGLGELVAAMARLTARQPTAKLLCVGGRDDTGRHPVELDRLLAESGLARERVVATGVRDDVPELLGLMSLLALPSHREGFPRAVMEASAMGLPVVASDERGGRAAVVRGVTGLLVPVGDVDALARALDTLLSQPALAAEMGAAGRRHAQAAFDQRTVFARVEAAYEELL